MPFTVFVVQVFAIDAGTETVTRAVDPERTARAVAEPTALVVPLLGAGATTGADCGGVGLSGAGLAGATGDGDTGAGVGVTGDGVIGFAGTDSVNPVTRA